MVTLIIHLRNVAFQEVSFPCIPARCLQDEWRPRDHKDVPVFHKTDLRHQTQEPFLGAPCGEQSGAETLTYCLRFHLFCLLLQDFFRPRSHDVQICKPNNLIRRRPCAQKIRLQQTTGGQSLTLGRPSAEAPPPGPALSTHTTGDGPSVHEGQEPLHCQTGSGHYPSWQLNRKIW